MKSICPVPFSRIFVRKTFCESLSKHLRQSLFLAKFHAVSIFFWRSLDGCFWSKTILGGASYFRRESNIQTTKASLKKLLLETNWKWKFWVLFREQKIKSNLSSCVSIGCAVLFWAPIFLRDRKFGRPEMNLFTPVVKSSAFFDLVSKPLVKGFANAIISFKKTLLL